MGPTTLLPEQRSAQREAPRCLSLLSDARSRERAVPYSFAALTPEQRGEPNGKPPRTTATPAPTSLSGSTPPPGLLSAQAERFRDRVIGALEARGIGYIDKDTIYTRCPVCDGILIVHFHGIAARADLVCHDNGCSEQEVAGAMRGPDPRVRHEHHSR